MQNLVFAWLLPQPSVSMYNRHSVRGKVTFRFAFNFDVLAAVLGTANLPFVYFRFRFPPYRVYVLLLRLFYYCRGFACLRFFYCELSSSPVTLNICTTMARTFPSSAELGQNRKIHFALLTKLLISRKSPSRRKQKVYLNLTLIYSRCFASLKTCGI